jgi:hypothetical protein
VKIKASSIFQQNKLLTFGIKKVFFNAHSKKPCPKNGPGFLLCAVFLNPLCFFDWKIDDALIFTERNRQGAGRAVS